MKPVYEWSHSVSVRELEEPKTFTFAAKGAELKALAQRAGLPSIIELAAVATVDPRRLPGRFEVTGTVKGKVEYICSRTGEVFAADVEGPLEGVFADKGEAVSFAKALKKRAEEYGDQPNFVDEMDDPEPLEEGGFIDLGELAAQDLILALDPYPISPNAPPANYDDNGERAKVENPFAVLGQLRNFMADEE